MYSAKYKENEMLPLWAMSLSLRAKRSITYDGD